MINIDAYRWTIAEYERPAHQKIFDTGRMHRDAYDALGATRGVPIDHDAPAWEQPFIFSDLSDEWQTAINEATAANMAVIRPWQTRPTEWEIRGSRNGE